MIGKGNAKLGKGIYTVSLEAGASCGGASEWCLSHCYAKAIQNRRPNVLTAWGRNLDLLRNDPGAYEATLRFDLGKLKPGSIVRIHVSGDFDSLEHIGMWERVAETFGHLTFYFYTRSWNDPSIGPDAFGPLGSLPNVHMWASTDATMPAAPAGWREARIFDTERDARDAGYPVCPEQTGRRPDCASCGLCWHAKPGARLAFIDHAALKPKRERVAS